MVSIADMCCDVDVHVVLAKASLGMPPHAWPLRQWAGRSAHMKCQPEISKCAVVANGPMWRVQAKLLCRMGACPKVCPAKWTSKITKNKERNTSLTPLSARRLTGALNSEEEWFGKCKSATQV